MMPMNFDFDRSPFVKWILCDALALIKMKYRACKLIGLLTKYRGFWPMVWFANKMEMCKNKMQ